MAIAALVTWIVTAVGGFIMLGVWLSKGALRTSHAGGGVPSRLVPPLIFSHILLAVAGLVVWITYLLTDERVLSWVAFGLLLVVALLGEMMFLRWRRSRTEGTPEAQFPVEVVFGHGLFAVITVVLVLLTAIGVGGS